MEYELMKTDSRPDNLAVSEDEGADKAFPIHIRKERKTKAYKETMSQYINNIGTYDNITNVNTTKWRPIYNVIYESYIKESEIFLGFLSENVKIIQTKHLIYHAM